MRRLLTTGVCCVALSMGCYVGGDPDDIEDGRGGGNTRSYAGFFGIGGNYSVAMPPGAVLGPALDFAQDDAPTAAPIPPALLDAYWDGLDDWSQTLGATWCDNDSPAGPGQCDALCEGAFMVWDGSVSAVDIAPVVMSGPDFSTVDVIVTNPYTGIDEPMICTAAEPCLTSHVEYDNGVIPAPQCACNCEALFGTSGGGGGGSGGPTVPGAGGTGGTGW